MACPTKTASASIGLTTALLALPASIASGERAASAGVIKCEGAFGQNASHAGLVKAFGKNKVIRQELDGPEGEKIKASVLYPSEPKARLEFFWRDEKAQRRPTMIRAKDQSAWATASGIRIGKTLAEVEKLNGRPFKLSGFDWDYGGRVKDWQGGALGKPQRGGCVLGVEFVHAEDAPEANLTKVSGDREFRSDNEDMRAVEPYVAVVTLSYRKR
ncbi:MAG TPA: hypothetical protein VH397_11160 [Xanthobacteraceae bacterium]|jgi:hypothetical protein